MLPHRIHAAMLAVTMVAIIACTGFFSCSKQGADGLSVGVTLPLTGDLASYGTYAKSGLDMAKDEINRTGGINGRRLVLQYYDDKNLPQDAVSIFKKLASVHHVPVVIGSAASSVTLAMAPVASATQTVLFTPISSAKTLTEKGGDFFFRPCPSDVYQSRDIASWMLSLGIRRVAIIYVNNGWGTGLHDEFMDYFTRRGGVVCADEGIEESAVDARSQISKVRSSNPEAIYAPTYGKEGGTVVRQARELGIRLPLFGGDVWSSPEFLASAGPASDSVLFTQPSRFVGERYETFRRSYRERYGQEPDTYAAYSYDVAYIVAQGLRAGNVTGMSLRNYLRSMKPFDGVTGVIQFDSHGDVVGKTFSRFQYFSGRAVEVK